MATTRFADHLLSGTHAARPAFGAVPAGTLYSCTTHGLIYQSDGSTAWTTYATLGLATPPIATDTIWDAKGDLAVGTGADTAAKLTAAANGKYLVYDSAQTTGLKGLLTKDIQIVVLDDATVLTTGDGKAKFMVPASLGGCDLTACAAAVTTVSSSGIPTIQIRNATQAADFLTTKLTIDASEFTSYTAATAAVIDTGNDDVATGDLIFIDCDVAGTGAKGLIVNLTFTLP